MRICLAGCEVLEIWKPHCSLGVALLATPPQAALSLSLWGSASSSVKRLMETVHFEATHAWIPPHFPIPEGGQKRLWATEQGHRVRVGAKGLSSLGSPLG